jgi:type VI secretion system protein VasD
MAMVRPRGSRAKSWLAKLLALAIAGTSIGVLAVTASAGCGSVVPPETPKPCDKQIITLDIYAAGDVNPDDGHPRPVVVRLYQLSSDLKLQNARYDDVLLKPDETLGKDIMKVDEVTVFPNDHLEVKFERIKEAEFLAGVALFHTPKGQSWKTFYLFPLAPGEATCGGRGADAGPGLADPRTAFFLKAAKIDNGSEMDESMFRDSRPVKTLNLPKGGAGPGEK